MTEFYTVFGSVHGHNTDIYRRGRNTDLILKPYEKNRRKTYKFELLLDFFHGF